MQCVRGYDGPGPGGAALGVGASAFVNGLILVLGLPCFRESLLFGDLCSPCPIPFRAILKANG